MFRYIVVLAAMAVTGALAGCAANPDRPEDVGLREMLERNQEHIQHLRIGMSQQEVRGLMGNLLADSNDGPVRNPFRTEGFVTDSGVRYEILYYYTRQYRKFHSIMDGDLTPILFRNGQVAGWGWGVLREVKGW